MSRQRQVQDRVVMMLAHDGPVHFADIFQRVETVNPNLHIRIKNRFISEGIATNLLEVFVVNDEPSHPSSDISVQGYEKGGQKVFFFASEV